MTSVTQTGSPGGVEIADKRVDFEYNDVGQFTTMNRYSDLDAQQLVVDTTYDYDLAGWLKETVSDPATASTITQSWTFDAAHRTTSYTNSSDSGTVNYEYDDTNQLTGETSTTISTTMPATASRSTPSPTRSATATGSKATASTTTSTTTKGT